MSVSGGGGTGEREGNKAGVKGKKGDVLYDFGSDDFAWAAPGRETVEDHEGVFLGEGGVEVGLTTSKLVCRV